MLLTKQTAQEIKEGLAKRGLFLCSKTASFSISIFAQTQKQ
jgi:hypothetical protein